MSGSDALALQATVLLCLGQRDRARQLFAHVLLTDPSNRQAHLGYGCLLAQEGQWRAGWEHMEQRLAGRCAHAHWNGADLRGQSILVHLDTIAGGFGDLLQHERAK